jgi:hypothetical protein
MIHDKQSGIYQIDKKLTNYLSILTAICCKPQIDPMDFPILTACPACLKCSHNIDDKGSLSFL